MEKILELSRVNSYTFSLSFTVNKHSTFVFICDMNIILNKIKKSGVGSIYVTPATTIAVKKEKADFLDSTITLRLTST